MCSGAVRRPGQLLIRIIFWFFMISRLTCDKLRTSGGADVTIGALLTIRLVADTDGGRWLSTLWWLLWCVSAKLRLILSICCWFWLVAIELEPECCCCCCCCSPSILVKFIAFVLLHPPSPFDVIAIIWLPTQIFELFVSLPWPALLLEFAVFVERLLPLWFTIWAPVAIATQLLLFELFDDNCSCWCCCCWCTAPPPMTLIALLWTIRRLWFVRVAVVAATDAADEDMDRAVGAVDDGMSCNCTDDVRPESCTELLFAFCWCIAAGLVISVNWSRPRPSTQREYNWRNWN